MKVSDQVHKECSAMVDILILVSMADRYFIGFVDDVKASQYFKQKVRRELPLSANAIAREHQRAFQVFKEAGGSTSHGYIAACDDVDLKMEQQIQLNGIERSSTILMSIAELIDERIATVSKVRTSGFENASKIIRRFTPPIPMQSNKAIEFIIEEALRKRLLNNVNN